MGRSLGALQDPVKLPAAVASNVFVLFLISGTTVGSYIAGVPALGVFWQQELVAVVLAAVSAVAALVFILPFMAKATSSSAAPPARSDQSLTCKQARAAGSDSPAVEAAARVTESLGRIER
jgi:hypothetical protein